MTQSNDNLMAKFTEGMDHKIIRTLKIFEFENTKSHVKKCCVTEKLKTLRNRKK